jgi:hypothetical protein
MRIFIGAHLFTPILVSKDRSVQVPCKKFPRRHEWNEFLQWVDCSAIAALPRIIPASEMAQMIGFAVASPPLPARIK